MIRYLPWDSAHFGLKIGQKYDDDSMPDYQTYDCVYWLIDSSDRHGIERAQRMGFDLIDTRITLGRYPPLKDELSQIPQVQIVNKPTFGMLSLACYAHTDSRFFQDSRFPRDCVAGMYQHWLSNCPIIFGAGEHERNSSYCGVNGDSIQLLAVDPDSRQNTGWGELLVSSALNWFQGFPEQAATQVRVVTQGRNIAAQRLYQKCGFRTAKVEYWFHRWNIASHSTK